MDVSPERYVLEQRRWHSSQYAQARNGSDGNDRPGGQFHFVWPNLKVNVYPGRPNLSIGPVWPEGPERSRRQPQRNATSSDLNHLGGG